MTAYEFLIKAINHRKDFSLISRPSQVEMACWHWILGELRAGRTVTLGPEFRKAVEYARALKTKDEEGLTELEALMKTGFWINEYLRTVIDVDKDVSESFFAEDIEVCQQAIADIEALQAENKKLKHKLEIKGQAEREYFLHTLDQVKAAIRDCRADVGDGLYGYRKERIEAVLETIDDALNLE